MATSRASISSAVGGGAALQHAVAERWQKVTGTRIAEGYATVSLTLKGGETLDGLLLQEREGRLRLRLIYRLRRHKNHHRRNFWNLLKNNYLIE